MTIKEMFLNKEVHLATIDGKNYYGILVGAHEEVLEIKIKEVSLYIFKTAIREISLHDHSKKNFSVISF